MDEMAGKIRSVCAVNAESLLSFSLWDSKISLFHFQGVLNKLNYTCRGSRISRWAQTLDICRREFCCAERCDTYRRHRLGVWINNYYLVIVYGRLSVPVKVSFSLAWQRKMEISTKVIAELREKFFKKLEEEGPPDSSMYILPSLFFNEMIFGIIMLFECVIKMLMCKGRIPSRSCIQLKMISSPLGSNKDMDD